MEEGSLHAGPGGEEFAALVLNPAKFGLFVELTDLFVEGLVPIDSLRDDRYTGARTPTRLSASAPAAASAPATGCR